MTGADRLIMKFQEAWSSKEEHSTFATLNTQEIDLSQNGDELDCRWFLSRQFTESGKDGVHVVFIGMNPSTATKFNYTAGNGDRTCARLLNIRESVEQFIGCEVARYTMLNLLPIRHKEPVEAERIWENLNPTLQLQVAELNAEVLQEVIGSQTDTFVAAAWNSGLSDSDWLWSGYKEIYPQLSSLIEDEKLFGYLPEGMEKPIITHPLAWPSYENEPPKVVHLAVLKKLPIANS